MGGGSHVAVLAEKGTKGPLYDRGGRDRGQVTASVTVSAAGQTAQVDIIFDGKKVICGPGKKHLNDLPVSSAIPPFNFDVAPKGFVRRSTFLRILKRFDLWLTNNSVKRPVILWVDGYDGHKGLDIAQFCRERQIFLLGKYTGCSQHFKSEY